MNITRTLMAVFVYPEHAGRTNVVRTVHWNIEFEDGGMRSNAFIETNLNVDNLTNFIPANEIGNERVLQWAFDAQGGNAFLDIIRPYHEDQIAQKKELARQQFYTDGFTYAIPPADPTIPSRIL